jgi:hypothetical protein
VTAVFIDDIPRFLNQASQYHGRSPSTRFHARSAAEQRQTNPFENFDKDYVQDAACEGFLFDECADSRQLHGVTYQRRS